MGLTGGRALVAELPDYRHASRSSYASEAAIKLFEFGVSADELTAILCEKRGRLKAEILSLRIR